MAELLLSSIFDEVIFVPRLVAPSAQDFAIDIEDNRTLHLYKAAISGDWEKAKAIFRDHPQEVTPSIGINELDETALHIATAADQTEFVKELVEMMSIDDLKSTTKQGNTAFFYAAVCGHIEIAIIMLRKDPALATIRGGNSILPIRAAALHGHRRTVRRLYEYSRTELVENGCSIDVLLAFIDCELYDIAIEMVLENLSLTTQANIKGETALNAFARKPQITCRTFEHKFMYNHILPKVGNELRAEGFRLLSRVLEQVMSATDETTSMSINRALFVAAKQGNSEFLSTVLHSNPNLAFQVDDMGYTIFHIAVLHRHIEVFNIIEEIDSIKNTIKLMNDKEGNNILHLAGKFPSSGLEVIPGPALQLQRELLWFEAVEKLVGPNQKEAKDKEGVEGRTPIEIFNEQHNNLRKEGEEWMKSTVNYCMVVSTLVAGVAFASSITVPGGTEDTGIPHFIQNIWFKIFALSNAISLISSASSILFFLTIFTSHYSMDDFKKLLPIKFILGLLLLSAAVQTMIVAFVASFFIMFNQKMQGYAYPIAAVASIPIFFFIYIHFPLVVQVVRSTFTSFFLFKGNAKRVKLLAVWRHLTDFVTKYRWLLPPYVISLHIF